MFIGEIWDLRQIGDGEMANEEGALPVHVIGINHSSLHLARHQLLKPLFHTLLVVLLCEPLHLVHQFNWDAVVHQLQHTNP